MLPIRLRDIQLELIGAIANLNVHKGRGSLSTSAVSILVVVLVEYYFVITINWVCFWTHSYLRKHAIFTAIKVYIATCFNRNHNLNCFSFSHAGCVRACRFYHGFFLEHRGL